MAVEAIRQNKLRSILTLLGISIGVFSVIGVMTAIRTLETYSDSMLDILGTNTFVIEKWPAIFVGGPGGEKNYRERKNIDLFLISFLPVFVLLTPHSNTESGFLIHLLFPL